MIRRMPYIAALLLSMISAAANAALTPEDKVRIDSFPLAEACHAAGSLHVNFGSTDHGLTANEYGYAERELSKDLAPFTTARLSLSSTSSRFYRSALTAPFASADDVEEAATRIGDRYRAAGWHKANRPYLGYLMNYEEKPYFAEVRLYSSPPFEREALMTNGGQVVSMTIQRYGDELILYCVSLLEEVWSGVEDGPGGTTDLALPETGQLSASDRFDDDACEDDKKRQAISAALPVAAEIESSIRTSIAVVNWKIANLIASGKVTATALDDNLKPLIRRYFDETRHMAPDWSAFLYGQVISQHDPGYACNVAITIPAQANALAKTASPILAEIHRLLNAEATRLGVSITKP